MLQTSVFFFFLLCYKAEDNSAIIQLNSVQVCFSSNRVSAVKSVILLDIKCLHLSKPNVTPSVERKGEKKTRLSQGTSCPLALLNEQV